VIDRRPQIKARQFNPAAWQLPAGGVFACRKKIFVHPRMNIAVKLHHEFRF
jgi:hypothetical protein